MACSPFSFIFRRLIIDDIELIDGHSKLLIVLNGASKIETWLTTNWIIIT